ncbi:hypothetical protein [Rosenbergiella nectarea]|uniref:hypothetical protein n=1 Tax=Rosenbergiella nectarea TaxID=988801 RepID=UPI001F4F0483|nr:hypothetical protein [Rosenbergiella nectarea]
MRFLLLSFVFYCSQCLAYEYEYDLCRNGMFPTYDGNYNVGIINKNTKSYDDECIDGNEKCVSKGRLLKGDEVLLSHAMKGFLCYWKDDNNVDFVKSEDVTIKKNVDRKINGKNIVGVWEYGDSTVNIALRKGGKYHISGQSYWYGGHGNLHYGELDSDAKVVNGAMSWNGPDLCTGTIKLIGHQIIINDNKQCGGASVSFDGVYQKLD